MKVIFFGTPSFVIPVLQVLKNHFELVGVVTAPDRKKGRNLELSPSPVKAASSSFGIPIFTPEVLNEEFTSEIKNLKPDVIITAAYGKLFPQELLEIPKHESLNVHPSLLPKYRGTTPIQSAMIQGDHISGVTIYKMDEKMDHGPILAQKEEQISPVDTGESLHYRLFEIGAKLLRETLPKYFEGTVKPLAQDHTKATFTKRLKRESGFIDLQNPQSEEKVKRMIQALYPWPGVWGQLKMPGSAEQIIKFLPEKKVLIEGKNTMSYKDFINGYEDGKSILQKLGLLE